MLNSIFADGHVEPLPILNGGGDSYDMFYFRYNGPGTDGRSYASSGYDF